jgi:hypothetical protein
MKVYVHRSMSTDVESYDAAIIQLAIALLRDKGAPGNASLDVKRVGDLQYPRTLVTLNWSTEEEVVG